MQYAVMHAKQTVHSCSCVGLDPCNPCITLVILAILVLQSLCHKCACGQLLSEMSLSQVWQDANGTGVDLRTC